jgi:hypothetical protein
MNKINKITWTVVPALVALLVGINLGREWAPKSAAVEELVFRAYIMGCVENVADIRMANEKCAKQALKYQSHIKEILNQ